MSEPISELIQPIWAVVTARGWVIKYVDYFAAERTVRQLNTSDAVVTTVDAANRTIPVSAQVAEARTQ